MTDARHMLGLGDDPDAYEPVDITPEQSQRISDLFHEKLAAEEPDHPWVKRWQDRRATMGTRALHVTADEAEKAFIKLGLVRNHEDQELRAAAMACYKADQALRIALEDLDDAIECRNEERTVETYDRLIAAALACHATDVEATQ